MTVLAKGRGGTRARRAYLQLARASFYIGTIRRKAARQGEYPPKDIECLVFEEMAQAMTEIELNTGKTTKSFTRMKTHYSGYIFPLEESEMMEEKL